MRRIPRFLLLLLPLLVLPGCWSGTDTAPAKCSLVRVEQGKPFCAAKEPPPSPPPFCTRSLGSVDCWSNPDALNGPPASGVADGPRALTPAQESNRTAHWPSLINE